MRDLSHHSCFGFILEGNAVVFRQIIEPYRSPLSFTARFSLIFDRFSVLFGFYSKPQEIHFNDDAISARVKLVFLTMAFSTKKCSKELKKGSHWLISHQFTDVEQTSPGSNWPEVVSIGFQRHLLIAFCNTAEIKVKLIFDVELFTCSMSSEPLWGYFPIVFVFNYKNHFHKAKICLRKRTTDGVEVQFSWVTSFKMISGRTLEYYRFFLSKLPPSNGFRMKWRRSDGSGRTVSSGRNNGGRLVSAIVGRMLKIFTHKLWLLFLSWSAAIRRCFVLFVFVFSIRNRKWGSIASRAAKKGVPWNETPPKKMIFQDKKDRKREAYNEVAAERTRKKDGQRCAPIVLCRRCLCAGGRMAAVGRENW